MDSCVKRYKGKGDLAAVAAVINVNLGYKPDEL